MTKEFILKETFFCLDQDSNELKKSYNIIKPRLNLDNIYHCLSHSGCSCGFGYDAEDLLSDDYKEDAEMGKRSIVELIQFLKENIKNNEIKLYSCWTGEESNPCENIKNIKLSEFDTDKSHWFNKNELISILE